MVILKQAESKEELYSKPGLWRGVTNGETRSAIISCPGCGDVNSLSRSDLKPGWTIAADGAVSPSVDHSWPIRKTDGTVIPSCTFHDYIKLEGWTA
jgi:hypothetical protein